MERKATRKENKEMDENKVIVSTEMKQALVNLRNLEEIYVIMSGVTKMPFVLCDEETFDDEVLVYYQEESAKEKAKALLSGLLKNDIMGIGSYMACRNRRLYGKRRPAKAGGGQKGQPAGGPGTENRRPVFRGGSAALCGCKGHD